MKEQNKGGEDVPRGPVPKNLPAKPVDTGLIPGRGRPPAAGQLSPWATARSAWSPRFAVTEAASGRSLCSRLESSSHSLQQGKATGRSETQCSQK